MLSVVSDLQLAAQHSWRDILSAGAASEQPLPNLPIAARTFAPASLELANRE
jgi:hypothetical protein